MKVEESLNVTFDETSLLPKTSPLEDDELVEEEAIEVSKTKLIGNDLEDNQIVNIKESKTHPLENVIGLWYPKGSGIETIVYVDLDHAGDYVDLKTTSGVCTFMGCFLTSWFSKKQTALAISTTEAEYVSARKACQQALWMKQALIDYGVRLDDIPIMCDNKGAIDLTFWNLNEDILKITISEDQYAVSIKEDTTYLCCTHQRPQRLRSIPCIQRTHTRISMESNNLLEDITVVHYSKKSQYALREKNAEESWALIEDLTLYDNKSWNDLRDFAKPVKAISLTQDASDRHLIELENQVQCLMEAHLALKPFIQVNKIASSCGICSGPHDTQYFMENLEQAFVDYASSLNEIGTPNPKEPGQTFEDEFKDLHLNLPVLEVLAHAPIYNAILDKYVEFRLKIGLLKETDHVFGLADGTKSYPVGIVKNVEVQTGKLKLLEDFYVIDMEKDLATPLHVGRGFLAIASAVIDCRKAKIAVGEGVTRSIFGVKEIDLGDEDVPY
ncbi:MAK10-like protein [Tanacetum coccineum]